MTSEAFQDYSQYYDLFYADKDHAAEAAYVAGLLERFAKAPASLADFGCGTGRHALRFAQRGWHVFGIEQSSAMLSRARAAAAREGLTNFEAVHGSAQDAKLGQRVDAATALFHVVSYQATDAALHGFFRNVRAHLAPGGCFVFDVWHADAVLAQRPEVRVARRSSERALVTRLAEPKLDLEARTVAVTYTLYVEDSESGEIAKSTEEHLLRYLTSDEIADHASRVGMRIAHSEEWMTGRRPSVDTWGVCYVARVET